IEQLKSEGVWIYAADMGGRAYYETDFSGPAAIVFGNEGEGISRLVRQRCDFTVSIPMYGKVGSLNVATAAAVILAEASRQHHTDSR
ncbi:MAG TPA: TrmH family RNA methyltransferase, partial [Bacillota bacterium]|nr:TrmH family RNA methyltransferase [Bacillota bacterium]